MAAHIAANLPPDLRAPTGTAGRIAGRWGDELSPTCAVRAYGRVIPRSHGQADPWPSWPVPATAQPASGRRGFDPAGALAAALAPRLGLPERPCLLRRDRERRQVGAGSRAQRRRSGRLTIELRAAAAGTGRCRNDVHTTGATLDACARALLAGGSAGRVVAAEPLHADAVNRGCAVRVPREARPRDHAGLPARGLSGAVEEPG